MPIWSFLSQHFAQRASFPDPYDHEELLFQLRKFVHDAKDYIRIWQNQIDTINDFIFDLYFMRLEVEHGGMLYYLQSSDFEPYYVSRPITFANNRSSNSFDAMQSFGRFD